MAYGGVFVVALGGLFSAQAAETQFTPIISVSETYTDNVQLSPPGLEVSDWVTEARAGFNFSGTGRRARLILNYTPSVFTFARQNKVDLRHQLSSNARLELVEDHLFLSGLASAYETFAGSNRDISISDRNISDDRIQVFSYGVTPEIRNHFGSIADATLEYSFRRVENEAPKDPNVVEIFDSSMHTVSFLLDSGEDFQRLKWGINSYWRRNDRAGSAANVADKSGSGNVRYSLTRTVALTGSLGYRDYGFHSAASDYNHVTWNAGVRLTPSRRAELNVSYGRNQRNKSWTVSGSYRPDARTRASVSYGEQFETSQDLQLDALSNTNTATSVPGVGGAFDFFNRNDIPGNSLTNQVFLQKRFSLSLLRVIKSTTLSVSASSETRDFETGRGEDVTRGTAQVSHTFNRLVSATASFSYINRDDSSGRQDDTYFGTIYISRSLVGDASLFVSYDYTRRDSNIFLFDMRENAVTAGISASF